MKNGLAMSVARTLDLKEVLLHNMTMGVYRPPLLPLSDLMNGAPHVHSSALRTFAVFVRDGYYGCFIRFSGSLEGHHD